MRTRVIQGSIGDVLAALTGLVGGDDPEFLDKPMMPGMTLTNREVSALFTVSESWDKSADFITSVDWEKTIALCAKFAQPENHPPGLSPGAVPGPEVLARRVAEARAFQELGKKLREIADTCGCPDCVAHRKAEAEAKGKTEEKPIAMPAINGIVIAGTEANGLVSSARVLHDGGHDRVVVFNRGANAGELTVQKGDGERLARRIVGGLEQVLEEHEPLAQMRDLIVKLATQSIDSETLVAIEADASKLAHDAGWIR